MKKHLSAAMSVTALKAMLAVATATACLAVVSAQQACHADQDCLNKPQWRCLETVGHGYPCVTDSNPHNTTCSCSSDEKCEPLVWHPSTSKKKYLMVGDSVSMGMSWSTFHAVNDTYESVHAPGNNGNTNWGSRCLPGWLTENAKQWDLITFNFGLHDLAKDNENIDLDSYETLLKNITTTLVSSARPDAKLIWVTTTPVPTNPAIPLFPVRLEQDVRAYNARAAPVVTAAPRHVDTCDLHAWVNKYCGVNYSACNISKPGGPHYTEEGFRLLGLALADCIHAAEEPVPLRHDEMHRDSHHEVHAPVTVTKHERLDLLAKINRPNQVLWGGNIHYTESQPGETKMAAAAFSVTRMDFSWDRIEKTKGVYDFSPYDTLTDDLEKNNIVPYYILDYGNPLYDGGLSPYTDAGIQAFTNFAVASAQHFKGKGIIWELWNEPNGGFWKPTANATAYARLALSVGKAWQQHGLAATETLIGPAADGGWVGAMEPGKWMYEVFESGVLQYFDAVSVHPYRSSSPETVLQDYETLRQLITKFHPSGTLPIISGEWGYSTCVPPCDPPNFTGNVTEALQARYLTRQWLVNALAGVNVSIWYDWRDGCTNKTQRECMFGTVRSTYGNASAPYEPKPAYIAATVTQNTLARGAPAVKRIDVYNSTGVDPTAFALDFSTPAKSTYAIWIEYGAFVGTCDDVAHDDHKDCGFYGISQTECEARGCCFQNPYKFGPQCYYRTRSDHLNVTVALPDGCYATHDQLGVSHEKVCASQGKASLTATEDVLFLTAESI